MWLMPVLVVTFAAVEYGIFLLFNQYGHPWKEILMAALEVGNKLINLVPKYSLINLFRMIFGYPLLKRFKGIIHHLY